MEPASHGVRFWPLATIPSAQRFRHRSTKRTLAPPARIAWAVFGGRGQWKVWRLECEFYWPVRASQQIILKERHCRADLDLATRCAPSTQRKRTSEQHDNSSSVKKPI